MRKESMPLQGVPKTLLVAALVFQLAGCGTILYPERRGQTAGRLDVGVVILDALGLLFFLIPGIIAFAVDFSSGCIYVPVTTPGHTTAIKSTKLRKIKFDPHRTTLVDLEKMIKKETGHDVKLTAQNVQVSRLKSEDEIMVYLTGEKST